MNKRPKSREETPKEGSDRARPYRTATICGRAAQSARVFGSIAACDGTSLWISGITDEGDLRKYNQLLNIIPVLSPGFHAVLVCQKSQLRDGPANQKSTLNEACSKADSKAGFARPTGITHRWRCATVRIGIGKGRYFHSGKGQP